MYERKKMNIPKSSELFDLKHTLARELLEGYDAPYRALPEIAAYCMELSRSLDGDYEEICKNVFVSKSAKIAPTATIDGPTIIGHNTEVRAGAFIRGSAIIGDGAVIGNSTEIKNAVVFDGAQLPHYNYVGDSIIGYKGHLGAGVIASNFRIDKKNITIKDGGERLDTGLRKMGVLLGDRSEVGSNSVIYPGCIIGRGCIIYPLSRVHGIIPEMHYYYGEDHIEKRRENT